MVGARWAVENTQGMTGDSASWFYGARFLEEVLFDTILAIDMGSPTFLLGPKGSGKTTLARQAAHRLRSRYHVAWLEGYPKLNLGQVTDACRRNFDPKAWEGVERGRTGAVQAGRPSDNLLIVEHAEAISPRFLEQLVAVSNGCEKTMPSHRILLTGDLAMASLIGVSHLQNNWGPPVALRLSAWPDEAVAPFLRHRLSCAGAAPSDVLTDATLAHIADAAGGNPQRMLELARDELQQLRRIGNADRDIDAPAAPQLVRSPKNELSWVVSFDEPRKPVQTLPLARRRARAAMVALTGFAVAGTLAFWSFERTRPAGVAPVADARPAVMLAVAAPAPTPVMPPEPAAVALHPPAPVERTDPVPSIATESEVAVPLAPAPAPPSPPEPEQPVATAPPTVPPAAEPEPEPLPAATVAAPAVATPQITTPQITTPAITAPTVTAAIQAPPAAAPPPDTRLALSPSEINDLIDRGNVLLRAGDFAAARLFYVQAARAGSGKANTAVAWTYDPLVLDHMGVISNHGDSTKAVEWYRRALALGDETAAEPLRRLSGP